MGAARSWRVPGAVVCGALNCLERRAVFRSGGVEFFSMGGFDLEKKARVQSANASMYGVVETLSVSRVQPPRARPLSQAWFHA